MMDLCKYFGDGVQGFILDHAGVEEELFELRRLVPKVHRTKADPSCAPGFYSTVGKDFDSLTEYRQKIRRAEFPEISRSEPADLNTDRLYGYLRSPQKYEPSTPGVALCKV